MEYDDIGSITCHLKSHLNEEVANNEKIFRDIRLIAYSWQKCYILWCRIGRLWIDVKAMPRKVLCKPVFQWRFL